MTGFEALFAFYALLLGLALANVSLALADMYRYRKRVPVGWTVPLLAAVVIVCICQQWLAFFAAQSQMTLKATQIFGCLAVALPYIVISRLIIPHEGEAPTMEAHYLAQRGLVAGMLLAPLLASLAFNLVYDLADGAPMASRLQGYVFYQGIRIAVIVPMLVWPSVRVQRTCLVLLGAYTLFLMMMMV